MTEALRDAKLSSDTAKLVLRAVRASPQPADELIAAVQKAGGLESAVWKLTPELVAELVAEVKEKGNPARGEAIYRNAQLQCMKCHAIGGSGGLVGPDLVSIGASAQPDYLVESLIVPTAKVKEGFHSTTILTDEGLVVSGIPKTENAEQVVLRNSEDKLVTIAKASIENRKDGRSLMPDGAADTLTRQELVDLTRFLSELGKVGGEYAIGQSRAVRRWQALAWTKEAHTLLNRNSFDVAASDNAALTWESAYSRVAGDLPSEGLPSFVVHAGQDPTTFLRAGLEVTTPGKARLLLGETTGLTLWIDGKPTPIASEMVVDLATGTHTLTLAVNRKARSQSVKLELEDVEGSLAQVQIVGGK